MILARFAQTLAAVVVTALFMFMAWAILLT
jgi:hypothetical protein